MNDPSKPLRLMCDGLRAGTLAVPPFEVRAGEFVKLQFPQDTQDTARARREVLTRLCAADPRGPVRVSGTVVALEMPLTRSAVLEFLHRQQAVEWFCRRTGLSRAAALPFLKRIDMPPEVPIGLLAGTPRKLLGLQVALVRGADVIVFDAAGLDPLGIKKLLSAVANHLGDAAAVYLATSERFEFPEIPFAAVVPVTSHQREPAPR